MLNNSLVIEGINSLLVAEKSFANNPDYSSRIKRADAVTTLIKNSPLSTIPSSPPHLDESDVCSEFSDDDSEKTLALTENPFLPQTLCDIFNNSDTCSEFSDDESDVCSEFSDDESNVRSDLSDDALLTQKSACSSNTTLITCGPTTPLQFSVKWSKKDLKIMNKWKPLIPGPTWKKTGLPTYIIDQDGNQFWNETKTTLRLKGIALLAGAFTFHIVQEIYSIAYHLIKAITSPTNRWMQVVKTCFSIVSPLFFALSAFYTILNPLDGRKLYGQLEWWLHDGNQKLYLAPCFQKNPNKHLFGGSGPNGW